MLRAIIIDDEVLALEGMARMLGRVEVQVLAAYRDPRVAIEEAAGLQYEVAFVDMEMPGLSGLETAARLQSIHPDACIVFVTAYDHYAVQAFELEAIDYLLKPVQAHRLEKAIERIKRLFSVQPQITRKAPELCCFHHLSYLDEEGKACEIPWRTAKAKELFAYLLHTRVTGVTKEALLDLLWSELEDDKAMANLHTTIYQIRKMLKDAGLAVTISYQDGRYKLDLNGATLDVDRWEQQTHAASLSQEGTELHRLLTKGYRGEYMEQEGYLWAENERERYRMRWLEYAFRAAGQLERMQRYSDAIGLYQQVQARYPLLHESYFWLMRLYDGIGDADGVHHQYQRLCAVLEEEIGEEPREEVKAWYAQWDQKRSN